MSAGQPWTPAEVALLRSLFIDQKQDTAQIAAKFARDGIQRTQKAILRKIDQERAKAPEMWLTRIPTAKTRRYNEPLVVEGDAVSLADMHVPFHDAKWLNRVLALASRWGIKKAIIAGDLADFNAFSVFGREAGLDADTELDALSDVMDTLCREFDVTYIAGNHDMRPCKALKDAGLNVKWLMKLFIPGEGCAISDYQWCYLDSGGQRFRIEHPGRASIHATVVPKALASRYLCHIIGAHGHVWGQSRDVSGRFWAIDSGVCCDPERMGYTMLRSSGRPALYRGAVIVREGVPILLGEDNIAFFESMGMQNKKGERA